MSKNNRGGVKTRIRKSILNYLQIDISSERKKELDIIIQKELDK